jgi:geranylgeranyl diphosphate synthase type II
MPSQPANLYEPVRYFLGMDGKRIRPLLVLIAADCFNGQPRQALPGAAAVELFHNFSLIHDDIMDKAPLRRGKITVHEKWNHNIAILSGDVLLVKAYQQIAECDNKNISAIFSQTAIEVCEGQQWDMDFESRADVSLSEYLQMIRLKTAVLLAASLQMGALCAGADKTAADSFYKAGEDLGIAFQLTDDFLDVFGNAAKTGKQEGGDIIANKKTWLLLRAFELANKDQREELGSWIASANHNSAEKVRAVKKIFTDLGVHTQLEQQIETYYQKAFAELRSACPNKEKVEIFIDFIKALSKREK